MELTKEHIKAIDFVKDNKSGFCFITGKAGCGKSTLLGYIEENIPKSMIKLAPTGKAALNIKGETVHSFFSFGIKMHFGGESIDYDLMDKLSTIDIIVIDEISMLRADIIDRIDRKLRVSLAKNSPFGGKLVIGVGDLYQLPPVLKEDEIDYFKVHYDSPYFFSAQVFKEVAIEVIELKKVFRQTDAKFINLLNQIRESKLSGDTVKNINQRILIDNIPENFEGVVLCTLNKVASDINNKKLKSIPQKIWSFAAKVNGKINERDCPVPLLLNLKVGAKVLFCKNNFRYKNGETGTVASIEDTLITVLKVDGTLVTVEKEKWEFYKYGKDGKAKVVGEFIQYPLKLGWAITIHKSQGMTINDSVIIDTGYGCFADGQFYVAMSRVTNPKNVKLSKPLRLTDIRSSSQVNDFFKQNSF